MSEISNQWLLFVVDLSAKSLALAFVAGITMKLLRLRDSNLSHRIWSGVLVGMLALPLLSLFLPTIPLRVSQQWNSADTNSAETTSVPRAAQDASVSQPVLAIDGNRATTIEPTSIDLAFSAPQRHEAMPSATLVAASPSWTWADLTRWGTAALFATWFSVTAYLAIRLVVGLSAAARIANRSKTITGEITRLCELPRGPFTTVCQSDETCVPVTVGFLRPTILLPADWRTWHPEKLEAIVAHEFTHVARRDFLISIGAELNRCLYWFHPLSWWLRTRLSDLAEHACDDAAIGQTGDRTGYAKHLLEVASRVSGASGRVIQPASAMARESNVASRIATILDFKRPLSEQLSWKSTTLIVLIMVPLIGAAAAVQAVGADEESKIDQPGNDEPPLNQKADADTVRIHGRVLNPKGQPVSGAKLRIYAVHSPAYYASASEFSVVNTLTTDGDGHFDATVPRATLIPQDSKKYPKVAYSHLGPWTSMVVSAPGFADSFIQGRSVTRVFEGRRVKTPGFLDSEIPVQLRRAVPIEGRLLSLEGQPVPDVSVSVFKVTHHDPDRIADWFAKVSKKPIKSDRESMMMGASQQGPYFPAQRYSEFPPDHLEPVKTDSKGRFRLEGLIAKDDVAVLRIRGKGITNQVIHVMGRDMAPVYAPQLTRFTTVGPYYGRKFDYVTQPSVPVFGVVRDIETKQPLVDVPVATNGLYGTTMSHDGYLTTRTDSQGRYRIEGLPIAPKGTRRYDGNELSVRPGNLPYIESDHFQVPASDGRNPIELNLELRRAVMANGRLTEKGTGKPLVAEIYYAPFATNENCNNYSTYSSGITTMYGNNSRYHSDADGKFRIPVIPGRGVIAAIVRDSSYVTSYGSENIEELKNDKARRSGNVFKYGHIVPSMYHSLKEINVPDDATTFDVELNADPGIKVIVKITGPDGTPFTGAQGRGLGPRQQWDTDLPSTVKVAGSSYGTVRPVFLTDKDRKLACFARIIPTQAQTEFEIQLLPKSQLVGRLVDTEGRPLADVPLETRHQNDPDFTSSLERASTDQDGRFKIEMPVGVSYSIICRTNKTFRVQENLENPEPRKIDLGDVIVDEIAERWSVLKAEKAPVISDLSAAN
ncbi:MAG: M56 family metallopeptidase [Planctomycetota bacterium]